MHYSLQVEHNNYVSYQDYKRRVAYKCNKNMEMQNSTFWSTNVSRTESYFIM